jgi:hypothetical protein
MIGTALAELKQEMNTERALHTVEIHKYEKDI